MACGDDFPLVLEMMPSSTCERSFQIGAVRPLEELIDVAYRLEPSTGECVISDAGSGRETHRLGPAVNLDRMAILELVVD